MSLLACNSRTGQKKARKAGNMTAIRTDRHENVIAALIGQGVGVVVLAAHLGDAAASCGALLTYAVSRTPVTVVTFFTEGGQAPYARSARRYVRRAGARDAEEVYRWRRDEDRAALEPLGITCVHAGLTEALFRRRPANLIRSRHTHVYPFYRVHATSGRIVAADAGMLRQVREVIHREAGSGPHLVLAPLGMDGHVDRVLVRTAAQSSAGPVAYYCDVPGSRRRPAAEAFIYRHDLIETRWPESAEAKADLNRTYGSLTGQRLPGVGNAPEVFFSSARPAATASAAWWR
jgi:LmbE family N-acetylglucosaminyl deacetylase